jgi:hypothetical protein
MPRPIFSTKFGLFGDWLKAGNRETAYAKTIIRKHSLFPDKSLKALKAVNLSEADISLKSWDSLGKNTYDRTKALQVAKMMREDKKLTLAKAVKEVNKYESAGFKTTEKSVKKNLGKTLYKVGKRWAARKTDTIDVKSLVFSEGKSEYIHPYSSKERYQIRKYHRDIQKVKHAGTVAEKEKILKKWKGKTILDKNGKKWKLETTVEGVENAQDPDGVYQSIYAK